MATQIQVGDWVKSSRYDYEGRVWCVEVLGEDAQDWIDAQNIPITAKERHQPFVSILLHEFGSVCVPMSSCTKIDPIKNFTHICYKDHFKD